MELPDLFSTFASEVDALKCWGSAAKLEVPESSFQMSFNAWNPWFHRPKLLVSPSETTNFKLRNT